MEMPHAVLKSWHYTCNRCFASHATGNREHFSICMSANHICDRQPALQFSRNYPNRPCHTQYLKKSRDKLARFTITQSALSAEFLQSPKSSTVERSRESSQTRRGLQRLQASDRKSVILHARNHRSDSRDRCPFCIGSNSVSVMQL